jgi:hypothetical protein
MAIMKQTIMQTIKDKSEKNATLKRKEKLKSQAA